MSDQGFIANDSLTELDHDDWKNRDVCSACAERIAERLDHLEERLRGIEMRQEEFTNLAKKIWGFVEQMKDNPMLSAMLGGLPRK
jgi:hypothetical protein